MLLVAVIVIAMAGQTFAGGFRRSTNANAAAASSSSSSASATVINNVPPAQVIMRGGGHRGGGRSGGFSPAFFGAMAGTVLGGVMCNGYNQPQPVYYPQPCAPAAYYPPQQMQVAPVQYEQPLPRGWVIPGGRVVRTGL